jgi:hypothetical protein
MCDSDSELLLVNIADFLSQNIGIYVHDRVSTDVSKPIAAFLTYDEQSQLIRVKNAALAHGFRSEASVVRIPVKPQMPSRGRSFSRRQCSFSSEQREVCEEVVTYKDAQREKLQLIRALEDIEAQKEHELCAIPSTSPRDNNLSLRVDFPDESSFILRGLRIPLSGTLGDISYLLVHKIKLLGNRRPRSGHTSARCRGF